MKLSSKNVMSRLSRYEVRLLKSPRDIATGKANRAQTMRAKSTMVILTRYDDSNQLD